jgi:hypothetical protein
VATPIKSAREGQGERITIENKAKGHYLGTVEERVATDQARQVKLGAPQSLNATQPVQLRLSRLNTALTSRVNLATKGLVRVDEKAPNRPGASPILDLNDEAQQRQPAAPE